MRDFVLAFIPILVAVDAVGVLPIYISLTEGLTERQRVKVIGQSVVTATALAVGFVFAGRALLAVLGIEVGDFMIAGGCVLFAIAILDILTAEKSRRLPGEALGVVPLGTPLIAGPAVLTTSLILVDQYGLLATLTSVVANVMIAGGVFSLSRFLIRVLGEPGTRALSKVTSLFLAAIAVMMVRKGLVTLLA